VTESLPETQDDGLISPTIDNDEEISPPAPEVSDLIPVDLTEEEQQNFESIITFGKKTALDEVFGHSVYLSTLTVEEELQVGLLVKPYLNTDAYYRAYKTAVVAASVKEIDGQPLYTAMSPHEDTNQIMRKKWEKIKTYYPVVVDSMYNCVTRLEEELGGLIEKISRKTSG
jgi:hypothetical protein